jgi:hypothetical protein
VAGVIPGEEQLPLKNYPMGIFAFLAIFAFFNVDFRTATILFGMCSR